MLWIDGMNEWLPLKDITYLRGKIVEENNPQEIEPLRNPQRSDSKDLSLEKTVESLISGKIEDENNDNGDESKSKTKLLSEQDIVSL